MTDSFWALISLLLFLGGLIALGVPRQLLKSLDARAERIGNELEEARRLREEAQEVLAQYQRRRLEAEQEAQEIVEFAQHEAKNLLAEARQKTEAYIEQRQRLAEQKIQQAEQDAIVAVRNQVVDIATDAAQQILASEITPEDQKRLFAASLQTITSSLPR